MNKIREVVAYGSYFEDFLKSLEAPVQNKIFKIIEIIETIEMVPTNYLKAINGVKGLFEVRVQLGSNIWRVFCLFDKGRLVILLNGFCKKSQKTPQQEIHKAISLMYQYYEEKNS